MSWKVVNINNPGTSIKFGADQMDLVSKLFNGITTGIPIVTIKSTAKFGFADNVLFIQNPAGTFQYNIRAAAITGNRDLNLPLTSATDTLMSRDSTDNPVKNKTLDATCSVAAAVGAGTPTNVNTAGQGLYKQKTGANFEFRGINVASAKMSVVLNSVTNTLDLDIVEGSLNKDNMAGSAGVSVLARSVTVLNIENSSAETSIFSYSVTGNMLSTNKVLRLTIIGDYLGNSATARFITLRIKYGATTLYADATNTLTIDAGRRAVYLVAIITNQNATNAQALGGHFAISDAGSATSGIGDIGDDETMVNSSLSGVASEDSTLTKTLDVTIQHSAAEANVSFRRLLGILELL